MLCVSASATLAINQTVKQMRSRGKCVYHFGFGQSPFSMPMTMVEALKSNAHRKAYLPELGLPSLREAVAKYYYQEFNYPVESGNIVIGPGSKILIFQLLSLLPGTLLLPVPSWVSYAPQAKLLKKSYKLIATRSDNNYCLQAEELSGACHALPKDAPKLLIINSPNNPTGCIYKKETLKELAEVCRQNNILVISDEIYAKIEFVASPHASIAHYYPEGTLVTAGLSKYFSAGGYRLGIAIVPNALKCNLLAKWQVLLSETVSCVSTPIQYAALTAYRYSKEIRDYLSQCVAIQAIASRYLYKRFIEMGLNCPEPSGAFYLMPSLNCYRDVLIQNGLTDVTKVSHHLLKAVNVAVLPGSDFGLYDHYSVRVAAVDFDGDHAFKLYTNANSNQDDWIEKAMPNLYHGCNQLSTYLNIIQKND